MRSPENVLKSLSRQATNEGYRYERLYRNLYNPEFYLLAYQNIAISQGSMTAGTDGRTLDGMSMERIEAIIAKIKDHSYQPNPARRVYIAKKNSNKKRPLGIPSTDDKLIQEVIRMILEAIYEPTFLDNSHGFRPNRSYHTVLKEITTIFTGAKWIIEGDIKACFDSFDHHITINLLRKRINDEAFISLMWKFLRAGYMEQWNYHTTYSGSPQGSGMSPILANVYLHELDNSRRYKLQDNISLHLPRQIADGEERIENIQKDIETRNTTKHDEFSITIKDKIFEKRSDAGKFLSALSKTIKPSNGSLPIGQYRGFDLLISRTLLFNEVNMIVRGSCDYKFEMGDKGLGNITRLENTVNGFDSRLNIELEKLETVKGNLKNSRVEYSKSFSQEEKLKSYLDRQVELNRLLGFGGEIEAHITQRKKLEGSNDFFNNCEEVV